MSENSAPVEAETVAAEEHPVTVLLVDDQPIIAEAVRRMLAGEADIQFHYCSDPAKAIEQANAVSPTVILQDLVMPEIDGLTLVKFFRANPSTREVPMIVLSTKEEPVIKAQAFAEGANDYLVKLPDRLEMIARLRYHSKGYIAQLQRNEAYRRLAESRQQLADEVAEAAKYVCSLLPQPIDEGPLRVQWRFVPSTQLGGDSFGYHWLDETHFGVYLLDVSGHGVGASLLSVSALNVLRSQALPETDFHDPAQVLERLNATFQMEQHDNRYLTIWYGVYCTTTGELTYAGGGHPAPLLVSADPSVESQCLESQGAAIGWNLGIPFSSDTVQFAPGSRLYVFSDGAFEIEKTTGEFWDFAKFRQFLSTLPAGNDTMDRLLAQARALHGAETLADDFSMVEVTVAHAQSCWPNCSRASRSCVRLSVKTSMDTPPGRNS